MKHVFFTLILLFSGSVLADVPDDKTEANELNLINCTTGQCTDKAMAPASFVNHAPVVVNQIADSITTDGKPLYPLTKPTTAQ